VTAADIFADQVAGPGQHQAAGNAFAMDLRDRRFCQIAPTPSDLQVDFLLARKAAMGVGLGETAPISDGWKVEAGRVLARRPQIMSGREMRAAAGEDDDLDRVVLHRAVKGGVEVVGHLQVLRVSCLGPVHHDPRDARLRPFHDDGLVWGHGLSFPRVLAMLTISANDRQEPSAANRRGLAEDRNSGMRHQAQTRNLEIPRSIRILSSGRTLRGPVGIGPE
jgi:hypothetical protein